MNKKGIKKYQWGTFSASGATPQMVNPGNAGLKQIKMDPAQTAGMPITTPSAADPNAKSLSDIKLPAAGSKGPSFMEKAEGFMGKYGGAISTAAGALAPLLMKKPDPNAKPYKKGTNMIKYQAGTKSLTKEEGKVGKGSEYFTQAKKLSAQEKAAFRKLDAEAKEKGMTFEFKGLKYDPTNPVNLSSPPKSNVGITYSSGTPAQSVQTPAQGLVTDAGNTSQVPTRTPRKIIGKVDAKTGYSIYPNNRVYNPKTQVMGKLDAKGNIAWDNGQKETITPAAATAAASTKPVAKDSTGKPLIKKTQASKEGELTDEDRALNADLISLGLDFGSIVSPEPISAGGMAIGSQIAVNRARRLRGESAGIGTHALETTGTLLSAVPLVGDYAKASSALKTIGRILKSPATKKVLTGVGAAGVGLGGEQALNSMNEIYQKYEKEGLTSLGKDDLRKAMEAARLLMNATQVAKGVSRTVKEKVTIPSIEKTMVPVPELGPVKPGQTKKVLKPFKTNKGNTVMKEVEVPVKDTKSVRRDKELVEFHIQKSFEKNRAAGLKKQEELSKEFEKKTGYKSKAEMRQAEEANAAKAREQKRADYKVNKELQKESQEALQQDYERKLIKFSEDVKATKEAVKKSFKNKQAAKRYEEQNTPQEAAVMRKMGDVTPIPIKMTPSQRLLPEGPKAPEIKLLPESPTVKAAKEKELIKYAEQQAKADIAAEMKNPKTVKLSGKFWRNPKARKRNKD